MAKDPAFLFYSQDFYAGTRTMLPEERACYIDLLIYQHQNGIIPLELKRVLMFCNGVDKATLEATLEAKFKQTDKGWYNDKLRVVMDERKEYTSKQSSNGKVGQFFKKAKEVLNAKELRKFKDFIYNEYGKDELVEQLNIDKDIQTTLEALLKASLKHLEDEDENKDVVKDINKDKVEIFRLWLTYRKEIKKPIKAKKTLEALTKKFNDNTLDKCKQVVKASIENGWQGLFWDRVSEPKLDEFQKANQDV